ncbi:MAG: hypothetical protein AABZ53_03560, partial [Planctomycetota bacterium]
TTRSAAMCPTSFGPFCCPLGYAGAYQDVPALPGETWEANGWMLNPDWDALHTWDEGTQTGSRTFLEVQFLDASKTPIEDPQSHISSKIDHPTSFTHVPMTVAGVVAPAGTAFVRVQAIVEQGNYQGGAAWWDDITVNKVGDSNAALNTSFEQFPAGCVGSPFQGWINFGNGARTSGLNARTGSEAAKLYGGFNGNPAYSGWFQDVATTEGTHWKAEGWARSFASDSLADGNNVFVGIEFYDMFNNNLIGTVGGSSSVPTPGDDTYRLYTSGVVTAPVDTVKVRCLILQVQANNAGGATWWDDMSLTQGCAADFDGDGTVDFFDYDAFVVCFETEGCTAADFDADGTVDFFDYDAFVIAFETPC